MANGKYLNLKKPHSSKNKNYTPKYAVAPSPKEVQQRRKAQHYKKKIKRKIYRAIYDFADYMENAPKFKMKRQDKQRILALLGVTMTTVALYQSCHNRDADNPDPAETTTISTQAFTPEQTEPIETTEPVEPEIIYSICTPNKGAQIVVGDKTYEIDSNSFIMFDGNEAIAYDIFGNFLKGNINSDDYQVVMQISSKELDNYNICQVISDIDVNVRSSGEIRKDNIISTVPGGDYVLAYKPTTLANDKEWISTYSINTTLHEGYIREDMLKMIDSFENLNTRVDQNMKNIENKMMIDTAKDGYIPVKLRGAPKIDSGNILTQIPHGMFVEELGEKAQSGDKTWTLVNYQSLSGTDFEGWIVADYLTPYIEPEQTEPTIVDGIKVNATGNVTVIDVSTLEPNDLRELLQNGIPRRVKTEKTTFNGSIFTNDISGVYIKIGATAYGSEEFTIPEYDNYIEQVAICEELGIPYGFYYYSASKTKEEADAELSCIEERIQGLYEMFDMQYNKLVLSVDIELAKPEEYDRQRKGDETEQTEAKATLINGLLEKGLSDNILIYGPMRVMKSDSDQIFDLENLRTLLSEPDKVNLWLSSTMDQNGDITEELKNDIAYGEKIGFSTVASQLVLDAMVDKQDEYALYDISNVNFDYYKKQVTQEIEKNEISYTFDIDAQDNER